MKKCFLYLLIMLISIAAFCSCSDNTEGQNLEALSKQEIEIVDRLKECIFQIIPEGVDTVQILEGSSDNRIPPFRAFLKIKFDNTGARWYQLDFDDELGIGEGLLDKGEEEPQSLGSELRVDKITAEINKFLSASEMQAERINIVKKAIDGIGSVDGFAYLSSHDLFRVGLKIEIAQKAYDQLLSDAEKKQVDYNAILKAEKYYNYYYDYDYAEGWAEQKLKDRLKNPDSLQIHSTKVRICYDSAKSTSLAFSIEIDYSAQNGFGGYVRDTFLYSFKKTDDGKYAPHDEIGLLDFYNIQEESNGVIVSNVSQLD